MNRDLGDLREHYDRDILHRKGMSDNPISQFLQWFEEAKQAKIPEPNAMMLSTVSKEGIPHSRIVLLKEVVPEGFIFYTNYDSDKGKDIAMNPAVSLNFSWIELEQQVRFIGFATKVSREKTNQYFRSRPYGSRIGAYTSEQSKVIPDRSYLNERKEKLEKKYSADIIFDAPSNWGGYLVTIVEAEYWQGRPSRLHDRLRYRMDEQQNWIIERLAP